MRGGVCNSGEDEHREYWVVLQLPPTSTAGKNQNKGMKRYADFKQSLLKGSNNERKLPLHFCSG